MQLCHCDGGDVLVTLLQLPLTGPLSTGGISFILKAGPSHWLGNSETYKDFHLALTGLPETSLPGTAPPAAAAAGVGGSNGNGAGGENTAGWFEQLEKQGPQEALEWDRWGRT